MLKVSYVFLAALSCFATSQCLADGTRGLADGTRDLADGTRDLADDTQHVADDLPASLSGIMKRDSASLLSRQQAEQVRGEFFSSGILAELVLAQAGGLTTARAGGSRVAFHLQQHGATTGVSVHTTGSASLHGPQRVSGVIQTSPYSSLPAAISATGNIKTISAVLLPQRVSVDFR